MKLEDMGWAEPFVSAFEALRDDASQTDGLQNALQPARISSAHRGSYTMMTGQGVVSGKLRGRLRHRVRDARDLPAVGDWVAAVVSRHGSAVIEHVLARRSALIRGRPAGSGQPQLIAANLDTVFVMCSLNEDFNPRRLERYLSMIWESGAQPVVLLSKMDLCPDVELYCEQAEAVAVGVPVVALSTLTGDGVTALAPFLTLGKTVALVGSSGVGKSTLANALIGDDASSTGEIRISDGRGRHTTTRRELFRLPGGALLLDTPGMREVGLWDASDGLQTTFEDVEAWAAGCRFHDCRHQGEPGCQLIAAIERGDLSPARHRSYLKLLRELAHVERQRDDRARRDHDQQVKRVFKARTRLLRHHSKR